MVEESAVRDIIRYHYTREAGVRSLERAVSDSAQDRSDVEPRLKDKRPTELPIRVTAETLEKYLGVCGVSALRRSGRTAGRHCQRSVVRSGRRYSDDWKPAFLAGQVLRTAQGDDEGKVKRPAVVVRAKQLGLKFDIFCQYRLAHPLPEGAIPKDGPMRARLSLRR